MNGSIDILWHDQHLTLLPQRAVHWAEPKLLIIADPHFGKTSVFRQNGVAIPPGTTADDLDRLSAALSATGAKILIVLGDLMHAAVFSGDRVLQDLKRWRRAHKALEIVLVKGNHDLRAGPPPVEFGVDRIVDTFIQAPFGFAHQPRPFNGLYGFGGHLHPAVRLSGTGRQRETPVCFHFGADFAVLPAFGGFTGSYRIRPIAGDRVFVIADHKVFEPGLV